MESRHPRQTRQPRPPRKRAVAPELIRWARENRKKATDAEVLLWDALRGRRLGDAKFRRQHPMGSFILDFWCAEHRLGIEVDGAYHETPDQVRRDADRDRWIRRSGARLLRFSNTEVQTDLPRVLEKIQSLLSPTPSPPEGEPKRGLGEGAGG